MMANILHEVISKSEWIVPAVLLYIVAWARFNTPPTNRASTTFALFFVGVMFYYALLLALWLIVIIGVVQGSIGIDWLGRRLTTISPDAKAEYAEYAPVVAALIIVVAAQFRKVWDIDTEARAFCIKLASIPGEVNRLAIELSQSAILDPPAQIRTEVSNLISKKISPRALNFNNDGSLAARFTTAVSLYRLFVFPRKTGTSPVFADNSFSRSAYASIMQFDAAAVDRATNSYEELIQTGLVYFRSAEPNRKDEGLLDLSISTMTTLTCNLVARYVLYCEKTHNGRLRSLKEMGFDVHPTPTFGVDHWATTILLVTLAGVCMMLFMPGSRPIGLGQALPIALTFGLSIGCAVLGGVMVAQRFIERNGERTSKFPPVAELLVAVLVVSGLSIGLRIGIPVILALINGDGFSGIFANFLDRLPGIITPAMCTVSLGLLCCYLGSMEWNWARIAAVGAVVNGLALVASGALVAVLIPEAVLDRFYLHPEDTVKIISLSTGFIGFLVGGIVLAVFNKSEHVRKEVPHYSTDDPQSTYADVDDMWPTTGGKPASSRLGGYKRADVQYLEGRYVCFRPAFSASEAINAYLISIEWDEQASCLAFQEQERVDAGHTQRGRVYVPADRPFMSFVTIESGAVRLIMVSRAERNGSAQGVITTLSRPSGKREYVPTSGPIVLRRILGELPQLGFITRDSVGYERYRAELDMVTPNHAFFAAAHGTAAPLPSVAAHEVGLAPVTVTQR
jgi:hypothetical protein